MKFAVTLALLGLTKAVENVAGESTEARSVWVDAATKYASVSAKGCKLSADCKADYVCAGHMWEYNTQFEAAKGCWHKSVCKDLSFLMFDERKI